MSEFKVKTQGLKITINEEDEIQKQIETIYDQVLGHKNNISFQIGATASIKQRLNNVSENIHQESRRLKKMSETLKTVTDKYEKTENSICKVSADNKVTAGEKLATQNWTSGLGKDIVEGVLDIFAGAGNGGKGLSLPVELLKILIDGDGLTAEDIGALLTGSGNSIIGVLDAVKNYKDGEFDKILGLDKLDTILIDSQAGWLANASNTFKETLSDQLKLMKDVDGAKKFDGATAAGWALSLIANGFSNYEEYQGGGISGGRAVAETISETLIDIGKGALITAGVAAGFAAIGVSAPVAVVAGVGTVVSVAADFVCKKVTGALTGEEKGLTETISDFVLDTGAKIGEVASDIGKKVGNVVSSAKDAFCNWGKNWKFGFT